MKKKTKAKKPRNLLAVAAHFRSSAGSMKDKKKANNKKFCRTSKKTEE